MWTPVDVLRTLFLTRTAGALVKGSALDWKFWFLRAAAPPFDAVAPAGVVLFTEALLLNGAEGQTRTADTYIFSVVLYRLSYLGTVGILSVAVSGGQAPWPVAVGIAILAPMPTLIIASLEPGEGRTTATAGIGARLAEQGRSLRLLRVRAADGADAAAEDDARSLAAVPGCESPGVAVSEQEAQTQAAEAEAAGELCLIEWQPGVPIEPTAKLSAQVILVSAQTGELRIGGLASAAASLGDALLGVVITRVASERLEAERASLQERGLVCLAALPEDRLLAGPAVQEIAEALHASRLAEGAEEDEAVEFVMLGPISSDPAQPYFLQHGSKAVINRFDKMDLHLAALATEPDCLILTGGQQPSPYLIDRVRGSDAEVTVLLSPEGTVRTMELLDELYGRTRFSGQRKLTRAIELFRQQLTIEALPEAFR